MFWSSLLFTYAICSLVLASTLLTRWLTSPTWFRTYLLVAQPEAASATLIGKPIIHVRFRLDVFMYTPCCSTGRIRRRGSRSPHGSAPGKPTHPTVTPDRLAHLDAIPPPPGAHSGDTQEKIKATKQCAGVRRGVALPSLMPRL